MTAFPEIILKLFIPPEHETLQAFYRQRIQDHNENLYRNFPDSGFDLGLPKSMLLTKAFSNKIPLGIHCSMYVLANHHICPQAYYLYPRSSIIKTPLRLSNSVGIIDCGYRGEITAVVDNIDSSINSFEVNVLDRYFQICHPTLSPFKVILVNTKEELEMSGTGLSERGDGGFGSTGR